MHDCLNNANASGKVEGSQGGGGVRYPDCGIYCATGILVKVIKTLPLKGVIYV